MKIIYSFLKIKVMVWNYYYYSTLHLQILFYFLLTNILMKNIVIKVLYHISCGKTLHFEHDK